MKRWFILFHYLRLMRIPNGLIAACSILAVSVIVTRSFHFSPAILLGTAAAVLIMGGGNALNDYFDSKIDEINKPTRPIPSGWITRTRALVFSTALYCLGVGLSFLLNVGAMSIAIINAGLLAVYARNSKKMFLAANVLVALMTSSVFIYAGVILQTINLNIIVLAASAFFVMFAREILKDIEDLEGDRRSGASTLPIRWGVRRARAVSTALVVPAVLLIFLPTVLKTIGGRSLALMILASLALVYSFFVRPKTSQKVIKIATLIVLSAFLAGSFQ